MLTATQQLYNAHDDLPEIKDGQSCVPGKLYKMSCNTCYCGDKDALSCTKIACFENTIFKQIRQAKEYEELKKTHEVKELKKESLRKKSSSSEKTVKKKLHNGYPHLPKGKCVPGMIYKNGCKKCFCNENKVAKCTRSCSDGSSSKYI